MILMYALNSTSFTEEILPANCGIGPNGKPKSFWSIKIPLVPGGGVRRRFHLASALTSPTALIESLLMKPYGLGTTKRLNQARRAQAASYNLLITQYWSFWQKE